MILTQAFLKHPPLEEMISQDVGPFPLNSLMGQSYGDEGCCHAVYDFIQKHFPRKAKFFSVCREKQNLNTLEER